jgi:hypothetical protein
LLFGAASMRHRPSRSSYAIAYTASPGKCGPSSFHFLRDSFDERMNAPFIVPTRTRTSPEA